MTIEERMDAALAKLAEHWSRRRTPKAFYLAPDDWDEFSAKARETARFQWGNNPPKWRTDPVFRDVPVRPSKDPDFGMAKRTTSRLYDNTSTGRSI